MTLPGKLLLVLAAGLLAGTTGMAKSATDEHANTYGVYEYVVTQISGDFSAASAAIAGSALDAGWQVLATVDNSGADDCVYRSTVFVLYHDDFAQSLMAANTKTGPFAATDRINLFEDESGLHVAIVNPASVVRTVLMDDESYRELAEKQRTALRSMLAAAVTGTASDKQYGPVRTEGYISKTMGVMAGGNFVDKLEVIAKVKKGDFATVCQKVENALKRPGKKWQMGLVFSQLLPGESTMLFGTTGAAMANKSYDIVKAGEDKSRQDYACPGLAHAGAYPIEVVVTRNGADVEVVLVDIMYRMKMYFEDAGKWAFMKNMRMPGSIQDEITRQIKAGLKGL